jgi:hypothetical protein
MLSGVLLGIALLSPAKFSFYEHGPYDSGVPKPESVLGYQVGQQHTVFRDQERVVLAIANAAMGRVAPIEYGKSTEGRPLRVFAISSADNIKNLEKIRANNLRLANPEPGDDPSEILKKNPVVVWINECIHGDETASFESAMALMYNLAASRGKRISDLLANTVVLLNPVYNPDGHERYVVAYNSLPTGNPDPSSYDGAVPFAFTGRANHYRFDMNRDRVAMSQAETRQEVALFLKWMPQVYVDQHGQVETYFFPPVQQSVNVNVDRDRYTKWTEIIGRATAKEFDQRGWVYSIRDSFDLYNVCYLDSHTTLMGAIGMTHETDGGRVMARMRSDETILTLLDGIAKHFTSALAVIESSSKNREAMLASYAAHKKKATTGEHAGKFQRVVVEPGDTREMIRFAQHLDRTGIKYSFAAKDWTQKDAHDYWSPWSGERTFKAGSLVVDMAQPMGHLAKSWLEPGSDFEPDFVARQKELAKVEKEGKGEAELDGYEFYDGTAWCHIYGYGLKAWWCESSPEITATGMGPDRIGPVSESTVGYYLSYADREDILFAARALLNGFRVSMNQRPMKIGGGEVPRGSFLFLSTRNEDGYGKKLAEMAKSRSAVLKPLPTSYPDEGRYGPGGSGVIHLRKPNIGIVMGTSGMLSGGPIWYLMEKEFGLPFTPLTTSALGGSLDRFTTIVLTGGGATSSGKFGEWIRAGGCAVSITNPGWAIGSGNLVSLDSVRSEPDLPGSLFLAELDRRSFLGYGYPLPEKGPIPIAVPVSGSNFFKAPRSGAAVMLSADEKVKKLLSGWEWDSTEKDLAGTAWLVDAPAGQGRAVLFTEDPTERAQWPGLYKMLLNAMIIGPSV